MQTDITFKNMDSSDALKDYALKRLSKMDKYIDRTAEAHVVLSVEKRRHKADVTLTANSAKINAVEITEDLYAAIDMVMDKIENQVKKHRSRLRERRTETLKGERALASEAAAEGVAEEPTISVEKLVAKPLDPEEAAMQLSASRQDFLVFRNSRSREINVIYKRKDGNIGLIEPAS